MNEMKIKVCGDLKKMKGFNKDENIKLISKIIILVIALMPIAVVQYIRNSYAVPYSSILLPVLGGLMLLWGILVKQKFYKKSFKLFSFRKWQIALLLFLSLEVVQIILINPKLRFGMTFTEAMYKVFYFWIFVGFAEELWFRGIWFEMFKGKFIPCVLIGSFVFGLWHWPAHGLIVFLFSSLVGLAFAVARFKGASILSLSIAHCIIDFFNTSILSGQMRFSFSLTLVIFVSASLFIAAMLMLILKASCLLEDNKSYY